MMNGAVVPKRAAPHKVVWSPQQVEAMDAIDAWFKRRSKPYFYLAGYAGTGKTTLAAKIARSKGTVAFGAFTGKAAAVLRKKGCHDATTIDALIYSPKLRAWCAADPPCEEPPCGDRCRFHREKFVGRALSDESKVADADLVIIDEVSMVGEQMGRDLLSFDRPILVLGDTAQLPPVAGTGFFTKGRPISS
jgi:exodeoxyribonuclease V